MYLYKKKGFSLVEMMIVAVVVSLVLAIAAPVFTKRMRNSQSSGCIGGSNSVKKIFLNNSVFNVPDNITGPIRVTMIAGGGGGSEGKDFHQNPIISENSCSLPSIDDRQFYTNITLNAVGDGEAADCSGTNPRAGGSGEALVNYKLDSGRCGYTYDVTQGTLTSTSQDCNSQLPMFQERNSGDIGVQNAPDYLLGGYPKPFIVIGSYVLNSVRGVGGSCYAVTNESGNVNFYPDRSPVGGACQINYRLANAGAGGGAGAYARFDITLDKDDSCNIIVGKGGASESSGGNSLLSCGSTTYSVSGGGAASGTTAGVGGSNFSNIPASSSSMAFAGNSGSQPSNINGLSGGAGGSSMKGDNVVYSEGARGGCFGAKKCSECSNVNGADGVSPSSDLRYAGSGGGGGSCNDNGCGKGGFGADGIVILEYRTRCY